MKTLKIFTENKNCQKGLLILTTEDVVHFGTSDRKTTPLKWTGKEREIVPIVNRKPWMSYTFRCTKTGQLIGMGAEEIASSKGTHTFKVPQKL